MKIMSEGGKKSVAEGISALAQAGALFAGEVAGYDVIIKDPPPRLASYVVDSIGRGSSHNIEVGPHAHDSKNNSLHHCQGKF